MTFLKKLGSILANITNIAGVAAGIGPILAPLLGSGKAAQVVTQASTVVAVGVNDLTAVGSVVVQMETALQGKTGAEKFAAAVALVGPIISTSQLVSGNKIANPALLQKAVEEYTQATVDLLNSIHPDEA